MPHKKLDILTDKGFVILNRVGDEIDPRSGRLPPTMTGSQAGIRTSLFSPRRSGMKTLMASGSTENRTRTASGRRPS